MKRVKILALLIAMAVSQPAMSQMSAYRWSRAVHAVSDTGWCAIDLPPLVLARSESRFSDFRLYQVGRDTIEAPFLLRTASSALVEKVVPFRILNKGYDAAAGIYELTLHQTGRELVNRIHLDFEEANFDWSVVSIEGSFDQNRWVELSRDQRISSIRNQDVDYRYSTIRFPETNYSFYRVRIQALVTPKQLSPLQLRGAAVDLLHERKSVIDTIAILTAVVKNNMEARYTEYFFHLPAVSCIDEIQLAIQHPTDFYRRISVDYLADSISRDGRFDPVWVSFASGTLSSLEPARVKGASVKSAVIRLRVYNRNDRPLDVTTGYIFAYRRSMVGRLVPGLEYRVVYGRMNDVEPGYDLVSFESRIPAQLPLAVLGPEVTLTDGQDIVLFRRRIWIWLAMAVAMVVLVIFAIRMIRQSKSQSS